MRLRASHLFLPACAALALSASPAAAQMRSVPIGDASVTSPGQVTLRPGDARPFDAGLAGAWSGRTPLARAHAAPSVTSFGFGLNESLRRDGNQVSALWSYESAMLGPFKLGNFVMLPLGGIGQALSGSAEAIGRWRMARYGAELDYGAGLRPAMARLKLDLPLAPGWAFDARLSAPLTHGGPSLDLAATRDIGSFRFGAFVDAAAAGGIIGLRLWLPLDPSDLPPRWFGR